MDGTNKCPSLHELKGDVNGQEWECKSEGNVRRCLGCKTTAWQQGIAKASHLLAEPEPMRNWVDMLSVYGRYTDS